VDATADSDRLRSFLTASVGANDTGAFTVELLSGGRSNLTFFVQWGSRQLVLRRPPLGAHDPRAHDVGREFRILSALAGTEVPVPSAVAHCTDVEVLGAPFYVMDRVSGRVLCDIADAPDMVAPARLQALAAGLVDGLAKIHSVDPSAVGLGDLGRADGYIARQVNRWAGQWETDQQRSIPAFDEIGRRLRAVIDLGIVEVDPPRPVIVHGDYNMGNVMVASADEFVAGDVLRAVLDWEMATLGHPLMDLGVLATYNGPHGSLVVSTDQLVSSVSGFPSVAELAHLYARRTGRDVADFPFFLVLAFYKVLVITEDVRRRFLAGTATGPGIEQMGAHAHELGDAVLQFATASNVAGLNGRRSSVR